MTEIAVRDERRPAVAGDFTPDQLDLIKRTICRGADDDELALFIAQASRTGLDPFSRQIHAVKRWDAREKREVMSIQVGIDGLRLIADRTGRYVPGRETEFRYETTGALLSATAHVRKLVAGDWHEVAMTARYDEHCQRTREGQPTALWAKMPHTMLAKCAESLALRRAFPAETSGLYTTEEMQQAEPVPPRSDRLAEVFAEPPQPRNVETTTGEIIDAQPAQDPDKRARLRSEWMLLRERGKKVGVEMPNFPVGKTNEEALAEYRSWLEDCKRRAGGEEEQVERLNGEMEQGMDAAIAGEHDPFEGAG